MDRNSNHRHERSERISNARKSLEEEKVSLWRELKRERTERRIDVADLKREIIKLKAEKEKCKCSTERKEEDREKTVRRAMLEKFMEAREKAEEVEEIRKEKIKRLKEEKSMEEIQDRMMKEMEARMAAMLKGKSDEDMLLGE